MVTNSEYTDSPFEGQDPSPVFRQARAAVAAGVCVLPTVDGGKRPNLKTWEEYQNRLPTWEELDRWFPPHQQGLGVVPGAVSGNLEALDFDRYAIFLAFCEICEGTGLGSLLARIRAGYQDRSPNGAHLLYRCETIEGNHPLAETYDRDERGEIKRTPKGKPLRKPLIETRGEGGFLVIPPSSGRTHPTGKPYLQVSGSLSTIATITPEERELLFTVARSLTDIQAETASEGASRTKHREPKGTRPGDIFNARGHWEDVLEPHGWIKVYERAGVTYWRRPGKAHGISATTNYKESNLLYVFSTSTDFDSERGYSLFSAFTLLNHNGDFSAAAEDLRRQGFCENNTHDSEAHDGAADNERAEESENNTASEFLWPVLAEEALYGLPGDIVRTIDPYTEADKVAVLITLLVMFGNCVNAAAYFLVEYTKHFVRLFVALVGRTAKGRKGQSLSTVRHIFDRLDPDWLRDRVVYGGLSSGEGLIDAVRDPRLNEKGDIVDAGESDKRLLLIEEELVSALKVAGREGNTLSAILRQAWDRGDLRPLTKNNKIRASGAHVSIISHITQEELLRHLTTTEQTNGFGNRFIWLLVKRSKCIPRPVPVPTETLTPLIDRLRTAIDFARKTTLLDRDAEAEAKWEQVYPTLSDGKPGLFGAITGRAEVQVMRLACLYALLDCSCTITAVHLEAALALWDYAEESAHLIFNDRIGDPAAERLLEALRANPAGLTDKDINTDVFARNKSAAELTRIKKLLLDLGLIRSETHKDTGGRPETVWKATN